MRRCLSVIAFAVTGLVVANCGGSEDDSTFDNGNGNGADNGGDPNGSNTNSGFGGDGNGNGNGNGNGGNGTPEVCDGVDNDGNGIIDDLDVGNDGVCDCLRVATLGEKGQWGTGDVFAAWLDSRSVKGATNLADQKLTPELLADYQVIVAQNLKKDGRTYSADEVAALQDWIKKGGGFLTLIGYSDASERTNVNTLLAPFGMSYGDVPILAKQGGSTIPVTGWVQHPVTDGISKVGVDNGYEVKGSGTTLATEQDFTLLKAQEVEKGHVLVWGDEWITYDSEWSSHPDYQVTHFWLNMIKWLTPAGECQVAIPPNVN